MERLDLQSGNIRYFENKQSGDHRPTGKWKFQLHQSKSIQPKRELQHYLQLREQKSSEDKRYRQRRQGHKKPHQITNYYN